MNASAVRSIPKCKPFLIHHVRLSLTRSYRLCFLRTMVYKAVVSNQIGRASDLWDRIPSEWIAFVPRINTNLDNIRRLFAVNVMIHMELRLRPLIVDMVDGLGE